MPQILLPIMSLLTAMAILFLGNGLLNSVVPLKAEMGGFAPAVIGLLGSTYFAGFLAGCLIVPGIVRRTGFIRAFAAFAAMATMTAVVHGLLELPALWIGLRLISGFAAAAIYLVVESWLNAYANKDNRGTVLGIYVLVNLGALALGQQFLQFAEVDGGRLFFVVALMMCAAVLPITLTRHDPPPLLPAPKLPLKTMIRLSPVGVVGCFLTGLANGPFWALAPSYGQKIGLSLAETGVFMSVPIIAGALSAWPVGLISDKVDRRLVIAVAWALVVLVSVAVVALAPTGQGLMIAMAIYGGAVFPINSLYVAHVNDVMSTEDRVAISSGLILLYGIGATLGPVLAGLLLGQVGPQGLFLYFAVMALTGCAYTVYRLRKGVRLDPEDREHFRVVPRTTPAAVILDARVVTNGLEPDPTAQEAATPSSPGGESAQDTADQPGSGDRTNTEERRDG